MTAARETVLEGVGLTKRYGGVVALRAVSVKTRPSEVLGIIGPNGSGKTTLFDVLTGMALPDEGRVRWRGEDITTLPPHRRVALGISRTFQTLRPFPTLTVLENVLVAAFLRHPERGAARDLAEATLVAVGLQDVARREIVSLAFPDLKRLEIARALATDPAVLLLDEVMAGLSPREVTPLLDVITRQAEDGRSVVVIEHIVRIVTGISHRLLVLHHGQIIAEGTPAAVCRDPQVIEAYLGARHGVTAG